MDHNKLLEIATKAMEAMIIGSGAHSYPDTRFLVDKSFEYATAMLKKYEEIKKENDSGKTQSTVSRSIDEIIDHALETYPEGAIISFELWKNKAWRYCEYPLQKSVAEILKNEQYRDVRIR